jgi:FtsP/CotA-like multicopper oxidase with cupredoxin domain
MGSPDFNIMYGLQTNKVAGAIQIKGPTSMNYDVDLGPVLISDWYHADAFSLYQIEIATPQAPLPATDVMNGKGVFACDPATDPRCTGLHERHEIIFKKGTTYKIGLVNAGSLLTYKFWIDGHNFTVIQTDFVSIEPYTTDVIVIGIGTFIHCDKSTVTDFL